MVNLGELTFVRVSLKGQDTQVCGVRTFLGVVCAVVHGAL